MDIQQYIALDKKLLLNLNGSNSLFWDGFMWVATSTYIWIPTAIILLYIIIKNNKIQETLLTIAMIALVITLADQIASGVCKPYFHRFRPTQDPDIMYIVDIVNGYRGGRFGFISSLSHLLYFFRCYSKTNHSLSCSFFGLPSTHIHAYI